MRSDEALELEDDKNADSSSVKPPATEEHQPKQEGENENGPTHPTSKTSRSSLKSDTIHKPSKRKRVHFAMTFRGLSNLVTTVTLAKIWNKKIQPVDIDGNPIAQAESTNAEPKKKFLSRFFKPIEHYTIDPSKNFYYFWLIIISIAVLYNYVLIIARTSFDELQTNYLPLWLTLDYLCDFIYLIDIAVHFRTGFLENGLLLTNAKKLAKTYVKSTQFKIDILSLLPIDFLAIYYVNYQSLCRVNRLLKLNRIFEFRLKSEIRTKSPYIFRIIFLLMLIIILIHFNTCIYYLISKSIGFGRDGWVFENTTDLTVSYMACFHWATLMLTTIGEVNSPENDIETIVLILNFLLAIILFASIVGNIGSMLQNMNARRNDFQNKVDSIKNYMKLRNVSKGLENTVIEWFDYKWNNKQRENTEEILSNLPKKLICELAKNVNLERIKKVNIFSDCEQSFLEDLVTKLKLKLYSPGVYVCRKGDIGKEMYIVKKGKLVVVSEDGKTIFVTLQTGAYFGELSILNLPGNKNGNRRTANVKSLGFSELFSLSKTDLWDALADYPATKLNLIEKGKAILRKDNMLIEDDTVIEAPINVNDEENYDTLSVVRKIDIIETIYENLRKQIDKISVDLDENIKTITSMTDDLNSTCTMFEQLSNQI